MKLFCKHNWETVKDEVLEPVVSAKAFNAFRAERIPAVYLEHTHILVLKCTKCGKLKDYEWRGGPEMEREDQYPAPRSWKELVDRLGLSVGSARVAKENGVQDESH